MTTCEDIMDFNWCDYCDIHATTEAYPVLTNPQSTRRLLDRMAGKGSLLPHQQTKGDDFLPSRETLESLYDLSMRKLAEIVKSRSEDTKSWEWHQSELVAAQELLDRDEKGTRSR